MHNDDTITNLTADNNPYTVGQAIAYFEQHGVKPERIEVEIAAKPQGTLSEILIQGPDPGTLWSTGLSVTLTINPGAVLANNLSSVLQRVVRGFQFPASQEVARRTLEELFFYLHEVVKDHWPQAWERWRKNKEANGEVIPFERALQSGSLVQFRHRLPEIVKTNLPELLQLLSDEEFAAGLAPYFAESNFKDDRNTHAVHYCRFAFLVAPETLAAEAKTVELQQKEMLSRFKRYLIFLYARLERLESVRPADLVQAYLRQVLAAGNLGVRLDEIARWFDTAQIVWLCEDLTNRRCRLFAIAAYVEKLAQYFGVAATALQYEKRKDGFLHIFSTVAINEKQRQRTEVLHHLLVPITAPIKYSWEAPYMQLGKRHSNELGRMRLR